MKVNRFVLFAALMVFSFQTMGGPRVEVIEPTFSGSGCPRGSADVAISPNAKHIEITFDSFFVEANTTMGHLVSTKNCDTSIRIKIPHGFSLAIERVRYNGVNNLPFGANAHLVGAHFFNHEEVAQVNKRFYGSTKSPFNISAKVPHHTLCWTACGEEALLSSRTNLAVSALKSLQPASVQVDDRDMKPGITYDLLWRSCVEKKIK